MQRRLLAAAVTGGVAALACFPVGAQIYRCPDGVSFALQQAPCAGLGQSGGRLMMLPDGRPAPTPVAAGASDSPRTGRALGRTPLPSPLPSPVVARKSN